MKLLQPDFFTAVLEGLYHLFIAGPTGMGKSKLIEALIQKLMSREKQPTIFLLDPGGSTAKDIENWALANGFGGKTIILDPEERDYSLAYNPLATVQGMPLTIQARYLQEAIYTALRLDQRGKGSIYYAPLLKQSLYFLTHLLMETGFTFTEASCLLSSKPKSQAMTIIERSKSTEVKEFWIDLQKLKPSQRQQNLGLLQAELLNFITSEPIQMMMGQREHSFDFSSFIESGGLFIANLEAGSSLTNTDSKLLTNLLISSIVRGCFARPPYKGREVYLILEEAGEVEFSSDIGTILRRARKQGLRTIILNQDICSMAEGNPQIFSMLWANSNHKICFGDLPFRDLEIVSPEFYGEELNLKEVKDELETIYFEPKETTRITYHRSSADVHSESEGEGDISSAGDGETYTEEGFIFSQRETIHRSETNSAGHSRSSGSGSSHSESSGETKSPFYEYIRRQQVTSRQFWNLDEQLHRAMKKLKQLERGEIALKRRGHPVDILKVPHVPDTPTPRNYHWLREELFKNNGYYATIEEIEHERKRRKQELQTPEEPDNPTEF